MQNENLNLLIDITILVPAIFFVSWRLYLRSKREKLLRKYKNDLKVQKMISTKRLVIAAFFTLLVTLKTIFDVQNFVEAQGDSAAGQIISILVFCMVIFLATFLIVYYIFKRNNLIIKP